MADQGKPDGAPKPGRQSMLSFAPKRVRCAGSVGAGSVGVASDAAAAVSGPAESGAAPSALQPSVVSGDGDDEDICDVASPGPKKRKRVRFDEHRPELHGIEDRREAGAPKERRCSICDNKSESTLRVPWGVPDTLR